MDNKYINLETLDYNNEKIREYVEKKTKGAGAGTHSNPGVLESMIDGVYTTEEKVVGKWIDGKPIYRKCGFKASLPANTATVLDTELKTTYVGTVIGYGGSVKSGNGEYFPFAGYVAMTGERVTLIVSNDGLKMLKSSASYTNANWWVEYTKTTD